VSQLRQLHASLSLEPPTFNPTVALKLLFQVIWHFTANYYSINAPYCKSQSLKYVISETSKHIITALVLYCNFTSDPVLEWSRRLKPPSPNFTEVKYGKVTLGIKHQAMKPYSGRGGNTLW